MDSFTLEGIHRVEQDILDTLDSFCKIYNIQYSLYAGTALGAIRHSGFIPWDDDVDVVMVRSEYVKFCEAWKSKPVEGYYFENYENDSNCPNCHGKLRKLGTLLVSQSEDESIGHHEIWIDIFPLDKYSNDKRYQKKTIRAGKKAVLLTRANGKKANDSLKVRIVRGIISLIPNKIRYSILKRISFQLQYLDTKILDNYNWISMSTMDNIKSMKYVFPKEMVDKTILCDFNGHKYRLFEDYDNMLSITYGDYMQLPPESERVCRHSPSKVKF